MNIFEYAKVKKILGGGGTEPIPLNVSQNGVYTAPEGQAYSPVNVAVKDIELIEGDYAEEGYVKAILDLPGAMMVTFRFRINTHETITVDWGDGTTNSYDYNGNGTHAGHNYASGGIYIVKFPVGSRLQLGITGSINFYGDMNFTTGAYLRKLYIDSPNAFIQALGAECMTHCEIVNYGGIYDKAFYSCKSLRTLVIPEGATSIRGQTFSYCNSLFKLVVPKTVQSIASSSFEYCYRLQIIDFSQHESVPTLASASAIYNATGQQILVPSALYDEWVAAENWSSIASRIVAV